MRVQELFDLKGKVAVVTGGGRGIGKFIARGLAEAGADLAIASRKVEKCREAAAELKRVGVGTLAVECDTGNTEHLENLIQKVLKQFGRID